MSETRKDDATDGTKPVAAEGATPEAETKSAPAPESTTLPPKSTTLPPESVASAPASPASAATPASPTSASASAASSPASAASSPASPTSASAGAASTPASPASAPASAASTTPAGPASAPAGRNKAVLLGVGGVVVLIAILALAAFVWPGFLAGPGKPDDVAAAAAASLGSKNAAELDKVSCHGPDGKAVSQLPPEALQLIQAAKPTGPATLVLDTQAQLPIDLTLSAQGQTQNVPASLVLAVDGGKWCMTGLSMRQ